MDREDLLPYVGQKLTVIAWLWARTVRCAKPGPADVHRAALVLCGEMIFPRRKIMDSRKAELVTFALVSLRVETMGGFTRLGSAAGELLFILGNAVRLALWRGVPNNARRCEANAGRGVSEELAFVREQQKS